MTAGRPEFSRPVPLTRLGPEPLRQEIAAGAEERTALARRFDLLALDRLSAAVELVRCGPGRVLLRAAFAAEFVQSCVVTLEPVAGTLAETFALLYGPPEAEAEALRIAGEEVAFEPLPAEAIDVGEAVAQEFSLSLPLFPRSPGARVETAAAPEEAGPFAALARLAGREP
jgi:uncharacterized metal-binding protein YceD (DUF177 family)